jgi:hypothetical protein
MSEWQLTSELRRFDDTGKLTNPRLQQKWIRGEEVEWRDVPLIWDREKACTGHIASASDPKICGVCGTHIDSLRPDDEE